MLVLTRQKTQRVLIGGKVSVSILSVSRGKVRLGIDAPKDVEIERPEARRFAATTNGQRVKLHHPG